MDPTAVAQQPTVWLETWLTKYGPAVQAGGFLGWFACGIAALVAAVAFVILVPSLSRAALEYVRYVESQIGPRPGKSSGMEDASADEETFEQASKPSAKKDADRAVGKDAGKDADKDDADVDAFVD